MPFYMTTKNLWGKLLVMKLTSSLILRDLIYHSEKDMHIQQIAKSREALETHIKEILDFALIGKVGHNEEVEVTTPVILAWHNGKSRMVADFRALNTYTVPDRYPIPKIQISLAQISQAVYMTTMDAPKGFHQNVVTPRAIKYLRITVLCGVYEYLRMPFGIKNAPSHFQRVMNQIFP
ncbi:hypothetical protein O181_056141 [Austropuccinia psidii MF-1]|uniref:Reverse transcriptase domain-containing protein n=1 Tax=Austropuccinia psidii MF-1 TaxID=1389203 RepID=A0A9Q3ECP5_9BASI|nr:hypothetical protein [Austropuccinia psidii MF-1]